jgi:hypothetical protein
MIVATYSKEDLLKLRDRVSSTRPSGFSDAVVWGSLSLSLQKVDSPDYDASTLIEDTVSKGDSEFIEGKYTLSAKVFQMPLEKMPLLLNHVSTGIQIIAMWRLDIAK